MARKSRKNIMPQSAAPEIRISEEVNLLRTAAYARLSSENSGHETEDTLNTQILQIHNYIKEHPELTLTDTYVDNGFTGTNFDRPEFERMMQDVRTGKIQCIVVKDLSRFGRDYIETGNYLETIFPMLHIRFIAINDDFDNIRQSDVDSLAVPIKNMVNSLYAKDISKKIGLMARSEQVRAECRNHFAGMVFCGCCRRNMTFVRQVHKTEEESYFGVFQCKRKKGTTPCSYHTVPEKMLMMVAMKQIHHLVSTMCEEEKMVKEMLNNGGLDSTRSIKVKENSIAFRIQETEERRLRLYEDYKAEILDEEEYSQLKEHYIAEKQRLEHELQKQRQRSLELEKRMRICDEQMERMRAILNQKEFDEELVHELIKKIYVGIDNSVEIEFKCSDPYQEVLAFVAEVQNE